MTLPANPFAALVDKLPKPLQNRYNLALLVFGIWVAFLDKNDLWTQIKLTRAVSHLEADRAYYEQKIKDVKDEAEEFDATQEKFAREHFFMRKPGEDVYIIPEVEK